ncbi:hypothetical protein CNYM01_08202 [Colletotrichum nymphaeae SA-01]|uniref:Uncharacterized protein n=1 Tax=Colletotrichum nymphaeae SA-01 TaxID=1460502 RepID=A0A135UW91_9PEZI|nr:hypothetical protein CNYM01_08202 [Colletotrichum nymphaeae SA-01]
MVPRGVPLDEYDPAYAAVDEYDPVYVAVDEYAWYGVADKYGWYAAVADEYELGVAAFDEYISLERHAPVEWYVPPSMLVAPTLWASLSPRADISFFLRGMPSSKKGQVFVSLFKSYVVFQDFGDERSTYMNK